MNNISNCCMEPVAFGTFSTSFADIFKTTMQGSQTVLSRNFEFNQNNMNHSYEAAKTAFSEFCKIQQEKNAALGSLLNNPDVPEDIKKSAMDIMQRNIELEAEKTMGYIENTKEIAKMHYKANTVDTAIMVMAIAGVSALAYSVVSGSFSKD